MAQEQSFTFTGDAVRQLMETVATVDRWKRNEHVGAAEPFTKFGPRTVRWAKTGTNTICETYPDRPANTFPIKLGELVYDDTVCGCNAHAFVEYEDPPEHRLALDQQDNYHKEGKIVLVFLCHGRWYIHSPPVVYAEAVLSADLCEDDPEATVEEMLELPDCVEYDPPPLIKNPNGHAGPAGSKVKLVKKKCTQGSDCIGSVEYHIVDVQLRPLCVTVGLDDRPSCLVAAGLRMPGEWCPAGEPVTACVVVPYTDCETTLPPCDQVWVFDALYACCGQLGAQEAGGSAASSFEEGEGQPPSQFGPGPSPEWFPPM